ncbi:gamma-glutamylcyclotransferase [Novosphingobium sp. TW-4]|uniref:Gamma-glutamylcyclotransferase n=1 Tax=Novosphingobium olei TaxID=2728851 RepID=A0A7Y0BRL1_9SPHN|nr:gamma-glutamylcyclotransferase family protein [Novosphingobium olei]NML95269.1 gamma-glutamylcyclotransferase [Novosphingobium olei]
MTGVRGRLFFFYGTLTHEHDNPTSAAAMRLLEPIGHGAVRGELRVVAHGAGWYPVLTPRRQGGWVQGWLYSPRQGFDRRILAQFDRYEEADRRWPEYRRKRVNVRIGVRRVLAEAYIHARALHPGLKRVPSGDFSAFVARCGAKSFASGTGKGARR